MLVLFSKICSIFANLHLLYYYAHSFYVTHYIIIHILFILLINHRLIWEVKKKEKK